MKRAAALAVAATLAACNPNVLVDPEGLRCDPGDLCPEGYACSGGVCRSQATCPSSGCACQGVTCTSPPFAQCLDTKRLRTFAATGTCAATDGTCAYPPTDSTCPGTCANGVCAGEPCQGQVCSSVPSPSCLSPSTLQVYSGLCVSGACTYPATNTTCINGCSGGRCVNQNLCAGSTCNAAPASGCVAGKLRTYNTAGSCDPGTGACSYTFSEVACPAGCVAGACVAATLAFTQTGPKIRHATLAVDQAPGSQAGQLLAVGPAGAVTRWNGSTWDALPSGTTQDLTSVWLASATQGWVVGKNKTLLKYDGTGLSPVALNGGPSTAKLVGVHGHGANHVLVGDEVGNYWRYDGANWTFGTLPSGDEPYVIHSVFVDDADHERLAGGCGSGPDGCVAYATSVTADFWNDVDYNGTGSFRAVGPPADAASSTYAMAGHDGSASLRRHKTFNSPYFDSTGVPSSLSGGAVVAISPSTSSSGQAVFVLTSPSGGYAGKLYRYTSAGSLDPASSMLDLWGSQQAMSRTESAGVLVADSKPSSTTLFRRSPTVDQVLDLGESWQGAAFAANGALQLMNSDGDVATRPSGGPWVFRRSPTAKMFGFAVGSGFTLVVGSNGEAYKVASAYASLSTNTTSTFRSVCRVSDVEWYLVGDGGLLRGSDGVSVSTFTSPTGQNLLAVACLATKQAVAVGSGGTVLRLTGAAWQPSNPPFPTASAALSSVAQDAQGALYVAGDGVFAKLEGGAWTSLPAQPGLTQLQALGPTDAYAIAEGNRVVHFDGTAWTTRVTSTDLLVVGAKAAGKMVFAGRNGALVEGQ